MPSRPLPPLPTAALANLPPEVLAWLKSVETITRELQARVAALENA